MSDESIPTITRKTLLPRGRILELMIKNVSKGDPLSVQEVEELKSIKALISKADWSSWLQAARAEKNKRINSRIHMPKSPISGLGLSAEDLETKTTDFSRIQSEHSLHNQSQQQKYDGDDENSSDSFTDTAEHLGTLLSLLKSKPGYHPQPTNFSYSPDPVSNSSSSSSPPSSSARSASSSGSSIFSNLHRATVLASPQRLRDGMHRIRSEQALSSEINTRPAIPDRGSNYRNCMGPSSPVLGVYMPQPAEVTKPPRVRHQYCSTPKKDTPATSIISHPHFSSIDNRDFSQINFGSNDVKLQTGTAASSLRESRDLSDFSSGTFVTAGGYRYGSEVAEERVDLTTADTSHTGSPRDIYPLSHSMHSLHLRSQPPASPCSSSSTSAVDHGDWGEEEAAGVSSGSRLRVAASKEDFLPLQKKQFAKFAGSRERAIPSEDVDLDLDLDQENEVDWNHSTRVNLTQRRSSTWSSRTIQPPLSAGRPARDSYMWGGETHSNLQSVVTRVCVASSSVSQSHSSSPIQIDVAAASVDVIWKESVFENRRQQRGFSSKTARQQEYLLHKDRFVFDDLFSGEAASDRLCVLSKQRCKRALQMNRSLAFVVASVGQDHRLTRLEAPLEQLLGSGLFRGGSGGGGGGGLVGAVLEEIFAYIYPSSFHSCQSRYDPASIPDASTRAHALRELNMTKVVMSVVVMKHDSIIDVLNPDLSAMRPPTRGGGTDAACSVDFQSDGSASIRGATRIQITSLSDFERVAGVLLGSRAAAREVAAISGRGVADPALAQWLMTDSMDHLSRRHPNSEEEFAYESKFQTSSSTTTTTTSSTPSSFTSSATFVLTITVMRSGSGFGSKKPSKSRYSFICPCGLNWTQPDFDLKKLSESINAIPNPAPPSLLRLSVLNRLFTNPVAAKSTDFVCVVAVNSTSPLADELAVGTLASLRVVAL